MKKLVHSNSNVGIHDYNTRSDFASKCVLKILFIKGAIFYNRLPNHLKPLADQPFQTVFKNELINQVHNSLTEIA